MKQFTNLIALPLLLAALISSGSFAQAHGPSQARDGGFVVSPYVQLAEPDSIYVVWQLEHRKHKALGVEYGLTEKLGQTQAAELVAKQSKEEAIYQAKIQGLKPNTRYYYRVKTDTMHSAVHHFITPALHQAEASLHILATSDIQGGAARFKSQILPNGIAAWAQKQHQGDLAENFDLMMLPGDLVNRGPQLTEWHTFFDAMHPLMAHVPVYPAIGNHDGGGPIYTKYFVLPENGTQGHLERWYYKDYSNVRIITLDSTIKFGDARHALQHTWLDDLLKKTATLSHLDFVLFQMHHPHESELWIGGNHAFTGQVINKAETFSTATGKPSMMLYGHTHGYSRGTSQDHGHLMVNVGGGGHHLDQWNEWLQNDYDRYQVSASEWGFAVIATSAGENPELRMQWHGSKDGKAFSLNDSITLRKHNQPPAKAEIAQDVISKDVPVEKMQLAMAGFNDPDNDELIESRWQIAEDAAFTSLVSDHFQARRNQYKGQDFNADLNLLRWQLPALPLEPGKRYYWRVRGRDAGLMWGPWSDAGEMTAAPGQTSNMLDTASNWQLDEKRNQGSFVYDADSDTLRILPKGAPTARAREWVKISKTLPLPADIQAGKARVYYGGTLSTSPLEANTLARACACVWVEIFFLNKQGNRIGAAAPLSYESHVKKTMHKQVLIPKGTVSLLVELTCGNNNTDGTVMIEAPYLKCAN